MIIVLGHGHGGTRVIASVLARSGVFLGTINNTGDILPSAWGIQASRALSKNVVCTGPCSWDFSQVLNMSPSDTFVACVNLYLKSLEGHDEPIGYKQSAHLYPWLVKLYPDAHFVWWERDPRYVVSAPNLANRSVIYGVPTQFASDHSLDSSCVSWAYSSEIMRATPTPKNLMRIYYEDFVDDQTRELQRLSAFTGMTMTATVLRPTTRPPVSKLPAFFVSYLYKINSRYSKVSNLR